MENESNSRQAPVSWQTRYRIPILIVTLSVVFGGVFSVFFRTGQTDFESALVLVGLAVPSIVTVLATVRWQIWIVECVLAIAAWATFLGPGGDLSCTDCGFALLIPMSVALIQGILLILGLLLPGPRWRDPRVR